MIYSLLLGFKNRLFQLIALYGPGAKSFRIWLHRMRGVKIGKGVFIGTSTILETSNPKTISIGNNVSISMRVVIIGHFKETTNKAIAQNLPTVKIEDDVFIGPGTIILPNVTIGKGAVLTAGSVVNKSIPPYTMMQGNPAVPIAKCGIPLTLKSSYKDFLRNLKKI